MKPTAIIILILSLIPFSGSWAQIKVSNFDLSFQYKINAPMRGQIISAKKDTIALLLLKFNAPLDSIKKYSASYSLVNSLEEEITTLVKLKNLASFFQFEDKDGSQFGIKATVRDYKYLIFWLTDSTKNRVYPYVKLLSRHHEAEDVNLQLAYLNATIFKPYVLLNSTLKVNSFNPSSDSVKIDFYDYHFSAASPPMSQKKDSAAVPFSVDHSYLMDNKESITLREPGLYYFHLVHSDIGRTLIAREGNYPKFTEIDRLVESLRYLETEEEYSKMTTSFNKKQLFDEFWLNNTKSESKARRAIKEYYKRVRDANYLFTSYKEGWKTDMGMIYIIFGAPSKVFIQDDGIMWIYNKTFELPRVAFFFNHINTAFTDEYYVLVRKAEFQNLWFRTIDLWRTGKKEF